MDSQSPPKTRRLRAAAIQLDSVVGDVASNLARVETLVDAAAATGARLIAVPEFFTSQLPFDPRAHGAVLHQDNAALDLLQRLARRHQCWIGGSMLVVEGDDVFNRYHFVEPDGRVHRHDKDLPTMWEGAFYRGGNDDGAFQTQLGGVGAAVCWELIRTGTVRRLQGRVEVAITGTHWWTLPSNWGPVSRLLAGIGETNRRLSEDAPAQFARRLGVPVLQASHCGRLHGTLMLLPGSALGLPYDSEFVGATQIVDGTGRILATRRTSQGAGFVTADIELGARTPQQPCEPGFWIPKLPRLIALYWHQQNLCGRAYYRTRGRVRGLREARNP